MPQSVLVKYSVRFARKFDGCAGFVAAEPQSL
jgi:hypothetical protein